MEDLRFSLSTTSARSIITAISFLAIVQIMFLVCRAAWAHELWLEKNEQGLVLLKGHTGATHGEREVNEYDPAEVMRVECFDGGGRGGEMEFVHAYPVTLPDSCAVVYVLTSSGYWTRTPFGTKRVPKNEAKGPIESWLSQESVKRIDEWSKELGGPVTGELELSPTRNPLILREGKKVRLLATFRGEPVEGIGVAYDGEARGMTDASGRVNIRLRHGGMQIIQASYSEPGDSIMADEVIHTTSLVFEIPFED